MGVLAEAAFSLDLLNKAWEQILTNDRAHEQLSQGVARFQLDAPERLLRLHEELMGGGFQPGRLSEVHIPKETGGQRVLSIPTVRDRIVARSILEVATPYVDPVLGPASFAYRPGLGVDDAIQAVVEAREEGLGWVLRTDVDDCFPSVPVRIAGRMFAALVPDDDLARVVPALLERNVNAPTGRRRRVRGLAQGCPLSPLLANLVLAQVDDELLALGYTVVRYSDDITVLVPTREAAWEAARVASSAVEGLGMHLGTDKTEIMSFDEGFAFLGEDFGPRYPGVLEHDRVEEPERRIVYVGLQGARARIQAGRLIVDSPDAVELLDVATGHVCRLVCFGSIGVSAGVRSWAMSTGVDVVFCSRRGGYLGQLLAAGDGTRVDRLRAQLTLADGEKALPLCRSIVETKGVKQRTLLRRFGRPEHAEDTRKAVHEIDALLPMLSQCTSVQEIMGVEGAIARAYFGAYGQLFPDVLRFETRSRRPPLDLTNSALSFLYVVLLGECCSALVAAGLDPAIGVFHADHDNRPSLALDLMEELRPMVVDQVVLGAARSGRLTPEHGRREDDTPGVMLTKTGRTVLLDGYERRMLQPTKGALPGFSGTIRRHLYRQAQRLGAVIWSGADWTGMSWR